MDYEKLHKDTIHKLQQMVNSGKITVETACSICADFVPESEDERIRKDIVTYLTQLANSATLKVNTQKFNKWIAWIEKQGRLMKALQISNSRIAELVEEKYNLEEKLKKQSKNNMGISEDTKRKLEDSLNEALEKETPESWNAFLDEQNQQHFELKAGHWYICHRAFCCRADHLTVKEGERFMCEKDGIVKGFVIKEPEKYFKEVCAPASMEDEQKTTNKVKQKPTMWSDDNEKMLDEMYEFFDKHKFPSLKHNINDYAKFIKSLKDKVYSKQEWSEEDERKMRYIENELSCLIGDEREIESPLSSRHKDLYSALHWLKSIKDRYTWKPSVEQMDALSFYLKNCVDNDGVFGRQLVKLYQDLKKLREE